MFPEQSAINGAFGERALQFLQNGLSMKKSIFFRTTAQVAGIIFLAAAAAVYFINPLLAAVIAFSYIVLCIAASFFPRTNFLGPVISRGKTGQSMIALTFDDGPAQPVTRQILDLLDISDLIVLVGLPVFIGRS